MPKRAADTRGKRIQGASTRRREHQKQDLRHKILDAAGQEFLEHGYENFSLRRVAECIGYSATTIYLYFHSKDDLLLATVQEGFKTFDRDMVIAASQTQDPLLRIKTLGQSYINFGLAHPALYRLMFMQRSDFFFMPHFEDLPTADKAQRVEPEAAQVADASKQERPLAQTLLVAAVQEGMAQGMLRQDNPQLVADMLWAGAHGLVSLANSPLMSSEYAQTVIDLLLNTLVHGLIVEQPT